MESLKRLSSRQLAFGGVGGPPWRPRASGSLFPMADIAVNGLWPVIRRLPSLLSRINRTAEAIASSDADVAVLIDAQDFNSVSRAS